MKSGFVKQPNQENFPKDSKRPAYPKGDQMPTTDNFDNNLKPQVGDTTPAGGGNKSEFPVEGQQSDAVSDRHQRAVEEDTHRGQSPNETAPYISPRPDWPQSRDLTQEKVAEKNDPTHDGKSFKAKSWEDKNFKNRQMLY